MNMSERTMKKECVETVSVIQLDRSMTAEERISSLLS